MSDWDHDFLASNWKHLEAILLGFCEHRGTKAKENLTYDRYVPIFLNAQKILTKNVGIDTPSVFKRSAAFLLSFLQEAPLVHPFKGTNDIYKIASHQNAIVAFEYVKFALHGATIEHETRGQIVLSEPIEVSLHFYADLIHALATLPKGEASFHSISLLIESLCYQTNKDAQDSPRQ